MSDKQLLVIVCVTAGKQKAVEAELRRVLVELDIAHHLLIVASPLEIAKRLKKVKLSSFRAAAIYGGDGTIIAAIKAFQQARLPVLILPGGTANVLANYYGLPETAEGCLTLYKNNTLVNEYIDIATIDDEPLVLDMHVGLWTQAIKATPRKLKKHIGEAAYAWSTIKQAAHAKPQTYSFVMDGHEARTVQGYTMLIANQGNHSILGARLFPRDHAPGLVQVAIIKSLKLRDLLGWYFKRLLGSEKPDTIEVHRVRQLQIDQAPTDILWDDIGRKVRLPLTISSGELSAKLLVPPSKSTIGVIRKLGRLLMLLVHRAGQRLRTFLRGAPSLRYSHVAPKLYLGGKYLPSDYKRFQAWGITGVVSMRTTESPPAPEGIELLRLPTTDWHPPTIEAFEQGVEFMQQHIDKGGSVYVHCRLGEGRGPSMAAAYLISKGFTVEEALAQLAKYRPVARPNFRQRKRLAEWQQHLNAQPLKSSSAKMDV